jgi:hypothetical protein
MRVEGASVDRVSRLGLGIYSDTLTGLGTRSLALLHTTAHRIKVHQPECARNQYIRQLYCILFGFHLYRPCIWIHTCPRTKTSIAIEMTTYLATPRSYVLT